MNVPHRCIAGSGRWSGRGRGHCVLVVLPLLLGLGGCEEDRSAGVPAAPVSSAAPSTPKENPGSTGDITLPQADQKICTAVAILLDTSGSMNDKVVDRNKVIIAKHQLAHNALQRIIEHTDRWKQTHPDRALQCGLFTFSDQVRSTLPMADFDLEAARRGLKSIPQANGGTAIGEALREGFQALYGSGCTRKYIICITDGQNTVGAVPDLVARQLHKQTGGEVEIHFVAFDTSAEKFSFLAEVNGYVVEASGAELDTRLSDIYERRILAETMPAER